MSSDKPNVPREHQITGFRFNLVRNPVLESMYKSRLGWTAYKPPGNKTRKALDSEDRPFAGPEGERWVFCTSCGGEGNDCTGDTCDECDGAGKLVICK